VAIVRSSNMVRLKRDGEERAESRRVEKVERLKDLEKEDRTLGKLALQFVLSYPAVATAIPGAKSPRQVEQNVGASARPLLSQEELNYINKINPLK
jgi:myo-inositol catabolism protein IolS